MLNIRTQKLGNTTVLHCVGRLTFPDADALRNLTLQAPQASSLILDLANVTAIDAAGLGALVSLRAWSSKSGSALKLMNVNSKVLRLLELTNLRPAFEICTAREMLDLLCRALHQPEAGMFMPTEKLSQVDMRLSSTVFS